MSLVYKQTDKEAGRRGGGRTSGGGGEAAGHKETGQERHELRTWPALNCGKY